MNRRAGRVAIALLAVASCAAPYVPAPRHAKYASSLLTPSGGTIVGVTAGSGLTGGGVAGNVTVNVGAGSGVIVAADTVSADTAYVQKRIGGSCTGANAIQTVNADGSVVCVAGGGGGGGTVTNITTGTGLTGGPITTTGTVSLANTAVVAGSYTLPAVTVDAQGRLTAASSYAGTSCGAGTAIQLLSAAGAASCITVGTGTVTGPGTIGDLPIWTGSTALGSFGGSSPGACAAGTSMTQIALSAAGVLTPTCGITPITGTLTTAGDLVVATGTHAVGNFAGSTCGAGTTATGIGATGGLTCGITPLTSANLSGTTNHLLKTTGANTGGDSNLIDDGTTATLGTSKATVAESTGQLLLNAASAPAQAELVLKANGLGALSLLTYAADNLEIGFDEEWTGSSHIARATSIGMIGKSGGAIRFYGKSSTTLNATFTPVDNLDVGLGGGLTLNVGGITATAAPSSFAGVTATGLTVDGNTQLGNAASDTTTVEGHLHGAATTPTVTSCGGAASIVGTDMGGTITADSSICTLTFGTTWSSTPSCIFEMAAGTSTTAIYITSQSTTAVSFTLPNSLPTTEAVNYICMGR